eukprot:5365494-Amphidinium_carterae.1
MLVSWSCGTQCQGFGPKEDLSVFGHVVYDLMQADKKTDIIINHAEQDILDPSLAKEINHRSTGDCPRKYPAYLVYEVDKAKRARTTLESLPPPQSWTIGN